MYMYTSTTLSSDDQALVAKNGGEEERCYRKYSFGQILPPMLIGYAASKVAQLA